MIDRDYQSLLDIIQSIDLATEYLQGKTQTDFEGDRQLQDAVVRRIWKQVVGMRNALAHQ